MDDLNTSDLQRISQDLKDAADAADPEMIREALERMASEQEAFQENLDRTIALLERVRNQQTLDALTSRLREMARDQADIHKQIAKQNRLPESLADRQAALKQEAETLQEAIEQAAESIKTPQDRLSELSKSFDRKEIPQRSAQTQRDMRAGQQDRSKTGTKELAEDLDQLATEMEAIRESYRQKQKDELIAQLTGIFNDLLNVSRSQERVASAAEQERNLDADALAQRQTRDLNATTRLAERAHDASKKTFLIPPKAGTGLQNAMSQIQKSVGNLQRGLGRRAAEDAREAMAGLNTAAMAAWEAITAVKGAGSATGLDEMLQQLAEASDRQGELNAETEGMMGKPGDQGEPQGGGFGSLSAEQQAIQQMLDELRQKFGKQEGDALGDLSKISQDMEDIAQRLGRNELNDRTVDRQRRILSRMLDAQRAMRQRGYSNDREAKAGTAFAYRGPGTLPQDLGETSNPLRTRLREALNQRYGEEDQTLIRRYFDRLMEDAASKGTP
jgi:chromosome segregation ATPase